MLRIRIVSAAAVAAMVAAMATALAATGAIAQSTSTEQTGQPLSLLQLAQHATTPAAPANSADVKPKKIRPKRVASRKHSRTAAARESNPPADPAQSAASADAWLAASATPANPTTAPVGTAAPPQSDVAAPDSLPSAVVVGGQTVQIANADQINAIDLAADNAPPMESTLPPGDRSDVVPADAARASQVAFVAPAPAATDRDSQQAEAQDVGALDAGTPDASAQNAAAQDGGAVGSAAWTAQVLAALGGAIAAGTVAWFLIGTGPARRYG